VTKILLVRHAMCDAVGQRIAGRLPGVMLNEEGKAQAVRLAERIAKMNVAKVYSSPLERAVDTASEIAKCSHVDVEVVDDLKEIDFGDWTGKTISELDELDDWKLFNSNRSSTRVPNGESFLEVQTRVVRALATIASMHRDDTVVAVSHADVIRAALLHYAAMPLDMWPRLQIDTASVSTVKLEPWGPILLGLNELC
jgi:probable phosphomutase (TIGR03848 family)